MTFLASMEEGAQTGSHDEGLQELRPSHPLRRRPWSSQGIKATLSPSPTLMEDRRTSKDDIDISNHVTPKRPHSGSLSLQMPPRDLTSTSTANLSKRLPPSPVPESSSAYPSPISVLPRRSRGLDFSRAATNLHHSIVAEHPSPGSSPSVAGRRSLETYGRKGFCSPPEGSMVSESPKSVAHPLWTPMSNGDRGFSSVSLGSSAICENSDSSSSDEMMDLGEDEETIHMTQHNGLSLVNPFETTRKTTTAAAAGPEGHTISAFTPAASKLLSYQRARIQSRRSCTRGSSSSASGQSNLQSPVPRSPSLIRSIETNLGMGGTYHLDEPAKRELDSRRESLSLGTNDMRLSDAEQSGDENQSNFGIVGDGPVPSLVNSSLEDRKQVVRRAVSRRGNLLPKSKGFARIKAALLEEGSPLDAELRREADVIKQVRESDADGDVNLQRSQPTTTASSPSLGPVTAGHSDPIEGLPSDLSTSSDASSRRPSQGAFIGQAAKHSAGLAFWNKFDERMRTPPPPLLPRASSSGICDDIHMETTPGSLMTPQQSGGQRSVSHESASSTPQTFTTTTFEIPRKGNKRMRDDEFDPVYFKRRAVSPSLSVQNSPVLPQSPGWWGAPKRDERVSSNGSTGSGTGVGKRVGMQGMNDTNDGLMNMSIE